MLRIIEIRFIIIKLQHIFFIRVLPFYLEISRVSLLGVMGLSVSGSLIIWLNCKFKKVDIKKIMKENIFFILLLCKISTIISKSKIYLNYGQIYWKYNRN